jgi:hypothetical protein
MRETLALFGQIQHPKTKRWSFRGSSKLPHMPNDLNTLPHAPDNVQLSQVTSCPSKANVPSVVGDPPLAGFCQSVLGGMSFFLLMQWLIITLLCLCHPSNHLMVSSSPWRSELIISPCVPVHWYLSAGYGPTHQKLRPPWAH